MELQLSGKVAVVTGASKGIGLAVTRTLLGEGARVVAASRTRTPELDALTGDLVHVGADFMDPAAPAAVVDRAVEEFGGLDLVVNNVGGPPPGVTMPRASFFDTDDDWAAMFELNLFAAMRTCRAAIPHLLERGGGSIVNVSTVGARQPNAINIDYNAAKAALNTLAKGLAEEFGPKGIRVNTVSPGPVRTAWWTEEGGAGDVVAGWLGTDREQAMTTAVPEMMALTTGRLADPQEIADAIVLLSSPRSASTNGADFVVDSGFLKSA